MNYVYHASKTRGLKTIEPRISDHGKPLVYATEKPEYCLMFLGEYGDLTNKIGFKDGVPYIAERFEDSLKYAFDNQSSSIYTLDGTDFKSGMTTFDRELVCDHSCEVIEEKKIENTLEEILKLESCGDIKIFKYPNLPSWLPKNKDDIVKNVVKWTKGPDDEVLEIIKKFHPDIFDEIMDKLKY